MKTFRLTLSPRFLLTGLVFVFLPIVGTFALSDDLAQTFESLRKEGSNAERVITGLQEVGAELMDATVFSVVNAGSIGLSIAYAQAGVCLAPDQAKAQSVGQAAVDSAPEAGRNAVQAGVVSALSSYTNGTCQQLLDQINGDSQAFAAPAGGAPDGGSPNNGTPPEVEIEEPPASESE